MTTITETARAFFEACEAGEGWEACAPYCHPDAGFLAQAEPLADIRSLKDYTDWMRGLLSILPDGRYTLKCFATDKEQETVCAYATFHGTHTGPGGPLPATGQHTDTDYVYVMELQDGRIRHMTKIWHAGWAMRELGWTS